MGRAGPAAGAGPAAAFVAHERALRGEVIDGDSTAGLPDVLDLPYGLAPWEPAYALADVQRRRCRVPRAADCRPRSATSTLPATAPPPLDDDAVELAVRQLVEAWTASSNGRAEVVAVEGDAAGAVRALGVPRGPAGAARPRPEAVAWMAWAGASGGAHGRRRGAAAGRFGALWLVAALGDALDDWPLPLDELGELAAGLRW